MDAKKLKEKLFKTNKNAWDSIEEKEKKTNI